MITVTCMMIANTVLAMRTVLNITSSSTPEPAAGQCGIISLLVSSSQCMGYGYN